MLLEILEAALVYLIIMWCLQLEKEEEQEEEFLAQ